MNAVSLLNDAGLERHIRAVINRADTAGATAETPALFAVRFVEGATLAQCRALALALGARLAALEKRHTGMAAANLAEAASLAADMALDIGGALKAADEAPCACGSCDACQAAQSDDAYQRRRDARLMRAG